VSFIVSRYRLILIGLPLLAAGCEPAAMGRYRHARSEMPRSRPVTLDEDPFPGATVLERRALIDAVLARNPDVEAARAGWRRALSRIPQETALDDPMVSYSLAPFSVAGGAPFGQRIEIEQKLPITNRRGLAGEVALAEAEAMRDDVEAVRLRLAAMASAMFVDYYVADRALEVDAHHRSLLDQMRASAEAQYVAGRAAQQDPLQAEVELAMLDRDRLMHETERKVVIAQINGLLHRDPGASLPPPPKQLTVPAADKLDERAMIETALRERPELHAQDARLRRGAAARKLADRAAWPDVGVMASYDSMWDMPEHRWMVGVSVEVPLARGRRAAARDEADAETEQAALVRERMTDEIRVEVRTAIERVAEARAALVLYEQRLLPASRAQVEAARAGFIADRNEFQAVIAAERSLRHITLDIERARADVHRRTAELDRAVGRIAGGAR
jgi:cobalt-zinc-cadmium efflux system outer membrane protein